MARKPRLEFEGAVYHVISRGNYRAHVFAHNATKQAFLKCLDEACVKTGWVVHAWCVMSNHYHLCVETPTANLVAGMRWLQSTFALRFNRLRNERGQLFQGRYHASVVAPESVGTVCHYIHLNPVRAKLIAAEGLPKYPWTSLSQMFAPRQRPHWTSFEIALADAGGLADTVTGWRNYVRYLACLNEDDAAKKELEFEQLSRGWAIGTRQFKKDMRKEHADLVSGRRAGEPSGHELAEKLWAERLAAYLQAMKKTSSDVQTDSKAATWKVAIAAAMKQHTTTSNPWLADRLNMGSPFRLSRLVTHCRRNPAVFASYARKIAKCKVWPHRIYRSCP